MAATPTSASYCRRWGVPLIDGGTVRLPRIVGQGRALEIILTGRKVPRRGCLAHRLCEHVTEPGGRPRQGRGLAQEIAASRRSACAPTDAPRSAATACRVRDALIQEWYNGREALVEGRRRGASRFRDGLGRHGDFGKIR
jgi:enoyl-CoA hydratase